VAAPLVTTRVPSGDSFPCGTCGLLFGSRPDLMSHYKGDLHRANLQRKVQDLDPLSHEQFQQREAARADAPQDKQDARIQRQEARLEQQLRADSSKSRAAHRRAPLQLASTQCIFSRKQFDSLEAAVAHMKKNYGFFIPDSECLTDLDGLMQFLREEVVTHHRCWFCGRVGRSYEATVQHMVDKSHCKLAIEGSYPDLAPFYTFGAAESATDGEWVRVKDADKTVEDVGLCRPVSAPYCAAADAAAAKTERLRKLAPPAVSSPQAAEFPAGEEDGSWETVDGDSSSADEAAEELPMPQVVGPTELVLPDGRVLGHRSLQRYYRQAPRRETAKRTDDQIDDQGQPHDQIDDQAQLHELQQLHKLQLSQRQQDEGSPLASSCPFRPLPARATELKEEIEYIMKRQEIEQMALAAEAPDDVSGSLDQLHDGANQPGRRVVAAGPPPIDKEARCEQKKGDVRRDRQRFKASDARGKIAGGRAVMWQVGL